MAPSWPCGRASSGGSESVPPVDRLMEPISSSRLPPEASTTGALPSTGFLGSVAPPSSRTPTPLGRFQISDPCTSLGCPCYVRTLSLRAVPNTLASSPKACGTISWTPCPSPRVWRVGTRNATFEACSGFTARYSSQIPRPSSQGQFSGWLDRAPSQERYPPVATTPNRQGPRPDSHPQDRAAFARRTHKNLDLITPHDLCQQHPSLGTHTLSDISLASAPTPTEMAEREQLMSAMTTIASYGLPPIPPVSVPPPTLINLRNLVP